MAFPDVASLHALGTDAVSQKILKAAFFIRAAIPGPDYATSAARAVLSKSQSV